MSKRTSDDPTTNLFNMVKNFFAWYFVIWILSALVALGLFAGVIWVIVHFVLKFW